MIYLTIFLYFLVYFRERCMYILILTNFLLIISYLFFYSTRVLFFFFFFEFSLVPVLIMVLSYGSQIEKVNSCYYLLLFSIFTSFPFIYVLFNFYLFNRIVYFDYYFSWEFVFFLSLGFYIKVPLYFLHFWLPKVHVEAPTSCRILLAGLLLKFGGIGLYRIAGRYVFLNYFFWLLISIFGFIFSCFICIFQRDSKSLAAYSSIVHINFILFMFFLFSIFSKNGGILIIVSHGYISSLIFFFIGEFYHKFLNRMLYFMKGFFVSNFIFSIFFSICILLNSGLPFNISFFSEFLGIFGIVRVYFFLYIFFFIYFFFSFYYSIYFLVNFIMGKQSFSLGYFFSYYVFPFFFMVFNIFWFFLVS